MAIQTIRDLIAALASVDLEPLVTGSFASGAWGHPRQTNDLDIILWIDPFGEQELLASLKDKFLVNETEFSDAFKTMGASGGFQLLHKEEFFKVDVFVGSGEFFEEQIRRARPAELLPDVFIKVISPEDIVIQKLRWYQMGGRVSDKQWNDLTGVIEVNTPAFDAAYLLHWARHFRVQDLAQQALEEARHPFGNPESEPER